MGVGAEDISIGVLFVLIGAAAIIWRRPYVRGIIGHQNRAFGFGFTERELRRTKIIVTLVGAGFVVFGLSSIPSV
jgi:hypothetical protein